MLGRVSTGPFRLVSRTTSRLKIRTCIVNNCIQSVFLRHPSGSVSIITVKDKVRLTGTITQGLKQKTCLSIFGGFNATRIGTNSLRLRFINTHGRSCARSDHGPVIRSKALRSSRGHHSFAVGTLTLYLGGSQCNRLISPFSNLASVSGLLVHAPLSPSVAFDSSPLHVVHTIHFTDRLKFFVSPSAFSTVRQGGRHVSVVSGRHVISRLGGVILSPGPSINFSLLRHYKLLPLVFPRLYTLGKIRAGRKVKRGSGFTRALVILSHLDGASSGL